MCFVGLRKLMGIFKLHQRCAAFCNRRTLGGGGVPQRVWKRNIRTWKHGTAFSLLYSVYENLSQNCEKRQLAVCLSVRPHGTAGLHWMDLSGILLFACSRI